MSKLVFSKFTSALNHHWELVFTLISTMILLVAVGQQYLRYSLPANGLFLGWDTPDYVRLSNDVLVYGPVYTISRWHYVQFYVLTLASVGKIVGLDNGERAIPLILGALLGVANYVITLRISGDRRIAAVAAILTPLVMGNLKLVSDNHRNLMAYAVLLSMLAYGLPIDGTFKVFRNPRLAYVPLGLGLIAVTQFETFAFFGLILLIASAIIMKWRIFLEALILIVIPTLILFFLFPSYFLDYFKAPILSFPNPIGISDLIFWTGGTALSLGLLLVGGAYLCYLTIKRRSLSTAIFASWMLVTMVVFWAIATGLIPIGTSFAIRSSVILPSAVLIALGFLPIKRVIQARMNSLTASQVTSKVNGKRLALGATIVLLIAVVVSSSTIVTAYNYGTFLEPYVKPTLVQELSFVKGVIGANVFPEPVFVFQGNVIWYLNLYRSYIGAQIGPNFAYYGSFQNLLDMKQTSSSSTDPMIKSMENFWGSAYFTELTTGYNKTSQLYYHRDMIQNSSQLLEHTIVVITPDLYGSDVPYALLRFRVADGIYVIKEGSLTQPKLEPVPGPIFNLKRDGIDTNTTSEYKYLNANSSRLATVAVNVAPGSTNYNLTSFPAGWQFLGLSQRGYTSAPEVSPQRPSGEPATVGNDPADSLSNWVSVGEKASIILSLDRMEGTNSLLVSGIPDSFGNVGATYSQTNPGDFGSESTISFWAKCSDLATTAVLLIDQIGNSRTYYNILSDGNGCNASWNRFVVVLNNWSSESAGFDSHHVTSLRLLGAPRGSVPTFKVWLDDIVLDKLSASSAYVFKGRVLPQDAMVISFVATVSSASPLPNLSASPGWTLIMVLFAMAPFIVTVVYFTRLRWSKTRSPRA